jgi:hypothetical protein
MSDLSQLYVNQQNKVSLFVDQNIKLNNVYLPRDFVNTTGTTASQVAIVGIDSIQNGVIATTTLYQKPFFSVNGSQTPQNFNSTGPFNVAFASPTIVNKNCGNFDPNTFTLTVPVVGYYRITYSVSKSWSATCNETQSYARLVVNDSPCAIMDLVANGGTVQNYSGQAVCSNSIIINIPDLTNAGISFQWYTNIDAGSFQLTCPNLTVELISPYTA